MYYRWSGSTLDILSSPLSLQIHRGWARILKIPLEACWSSELQRSRSPISQKIYLIAKPRSAVLHWSSARDISLRYSLLCPSKPFWLHCGLFCFPLWTRVTPTCPDCSASPFGLVWSCLGAMNLSGFRTTDRGFEENVTFDRGCAPAQKSLVQVLFWDQLRHFQGFSQMIDK